MADALNRRINVHTCRQHHTVIRFLLDEFPASPPPAQEIVDFLERLKMVLTRHFRLEDHHVYPALSESSDSEVRATAREFRLRMGNLMQTFADLHTRWTVNAVERDLAGFERDWNGFREALVTRMDAEDNFLYPKAEMEARLLLDRPDDEPRASAES